MEVGKGDPGEEEGERNTAAKEVQNVARLKPVKMLGKGEGVETKSISEEGCFFLFFEKRPRLERGKTGPPRGAFIRGKIG